MSNVTMPNVTTILWDTHSRNFHWEYSECIDTSLSMRGWYHVDKQKDLWRSFCGNLPAELFLNTKGQEVYILHLGGRNYAVFSLHRKDVETFLKDHRLELPIQEHDTL